MKRQLRKTSNNDEGTSRFPLFKCILLLLSVLAGAHLGNNSSWGRAEKGEMEMIPGLRMTSVSKQDEIQERAKLSAPNEDILPLATDAIADPWKRKLYEQLDRIRKKCGRMCSINDLAEYQKLGFHQPGKAFSTFQVPVDCQNLFEMDEIDAGETKVPYPIPEEILKFYSLNGAIKINYMDRFVDVYLGGDALTNVWKKEDIERDIELLGKHQLKGTYGTAETTKIMQQIERQGGLTGKSVLVVGSARPWLETIALRLGAAKVTTLEYGSIQTDHPKISTMTPDVFRKMYLAGELTKFDAILTYSSLEHSGLGRYGDALNPWGDILSLARCWCAAKDDATLMIGLPVGPDSVEFNGHRIYGNIRMPLLTMNWEPMDGTVNFEKPPGKAFQYPHFFKKVSL